jgi:hypothetical protein
MPTTGNANTTAIQTIRDDGSQLGRVRACTVVINWARNRIRYSVEIS